MPRIYKGPLEGLDPSIQHLYNMKEWKVMAITFVITREEVNVAITQLEQIEGEREQAEREAEWRRECEECEERRLKDRSHWVIADT
jgi:hypothetical protein